MVTCVSASQLSVSPALPIITKGDTVWFDPDVGYFLPGVVVDFCRAAQVATIEADFSGQVSVCFYFGDRLYLLTALVAETKIQERRLSHLRLRSSA